MIRALLMAATFALGAVGATQAHAQQTVRFPSADGRTTLTGYLFSPNAANGTQRPAVVLMHGRAGAYSSLARGQFTAETLSKRHRAWGEMLAQAGYVALLVDGFGPRGYPQGFPRGSYEDRPAELNEVTVRPRDAYGALAYLRTRRDVAPNNIALLGWSNGGSATLAALAADDALTSPAERQFRLGVALYPACGLKGQFENGYRPYAPVSVFIGDADEEVSPKRCAALVEQSRSAGGRISIQVYPGATHSFDDPGARRQSNPANADATTDATNRILQILAQGLQTR